MKKILLTFFVLLMAFFQAQVKKKILTKEKQRFERQWINPVKLTKDERNRPYMDEVLKTKDSITPEEAERRRKNIAIGNPFAKYGQYPKIATLSKGKYLEFHDKDSIVNIGSVKYNRKSKEIVQFRKIDLSDPDVQPYLDTAGRWISPDPLSEEFPDWTPYRYGFNNPIKFTDPTGMLEDWYQDDNGDYVYDASLNVNNASSKLNSNQKYLGESSTINVNDNAGNQVGQINLNKDGGVDVKGNFANDGHIKYSFMGTENGNVQVVDAGFASKAKIYGADTNSYANMYENMDGSSTNDIKFEYNAKGIANNDPSYVPQKLPTSDTAVGRVINSNAGSGIAPYCSQCPPSTAGPGPMSTGDVNAYNGYRIGVGINHVLWHVLFKDSDKNTQPNKGGK